MGGADQNNNTPSRRGAFGLTIIFIVCAVIAATMLMMGATLLVARWLGSLIVALGVLGGTFAIIALVLYWSSVRPTLHKLRSEIELISQIAQLLNRGYNWVSTLIGTLLNNLMS